MAGGTTHLVARLLWAAVAILLIPGARSADTILGNCPDYKQSWVQTRDVRDVSSPRYTLGQLYFSSTAYTEGLNATTGKSLWWKQHAQSTAPVAPTLYRTPTSTPESGVFVCLTVAGENTPKNPYRIYSDPALGGDVAERYWVYSFENRTQSAPVVTTEYEVVLLSAQYTLILLDAAPTDSPVGQFVWAIHSHEVDLESVAATEFLSATLVVYDEAVHIVAPTPQGLWAVNLGNTFPLEGSPSRPPSQWSTRDILQPTYGPGMESYPPAAYEGNVYLPSVNGGYNYICSVSVQLGHETWRYNMTELLGAGLEVLPVVVTRDSVVAVAIPTEGSKVDPRVVVLQRGTGELKWDTRLPNAVLGMPAAGNGRVFVPSFGDENTRVFIFAEGQGDQLCTAVVSHGTADIRPDPATPWVVAYDNSFALLRALEERTVVIGASEVHNTPVPTAVPITRAPASPTSEDTGFGVTELALLVVGCVGCVLLTACIFAMLIREKRRVPKNRKVGAGSKSKYKVVKELGRGAYGVVYLVQRKTDNELLAMKYLQCKDDQAQEEALTEFKFLRQFQGHPNMVGVVETFMSWTNSPSRESHGTFIDSNRYVCLVMPYYKRGDLKHFVLNYPDECLPEEMLLRMSEQLCSLLHYLHFRQPPLIHRDLKPENVLISDDGRPIVADFGLAKNLETMYCATRAGTAAFLAPECWGKHYGVEVDIWAIGCILYASATRRVRSENIRVMFSDAAKPGFVEEIMSDLGNRGYTKLFSDLVVSMLEFDYHKRPKAYDIVSSLRRRREGGGGCDDSAEHALPVLASTPPAPLAISHRTKDSQATMYTSSDLQQPLLAGQGTPDCDSTELQSYPGGTSSAGAEHMPAGHRLIAPPHSSTTLPTASTTPLSRDSRFNGVQAMLSKDSQATQFVSSVDEVQAVNLPQPLHPLQQPVLDSQATVLLSSEDGSARQVSPQLPEVPQMEFSTTPVPLQHALLPPDAIAHGIVPSSMQRAKGMGHGLQVDEDLATLESQATVMLSEHSSNNLQEDEVEMNQVRQAPELAYGDVQLLSAEEAKQLQVQLHLQQQQAPSPAQSDCTIEQTESDVTIDDVS